MEIKTYQGTAHGGSLDKLTKMDNERILKFKNPKEAVAYLENPDVKLSKPSLAVLDDGSIIIHSGAFE